MADNNVIAVNFGNNIVPDYNPAGKTKADTAAVSGTRRMPMGESAFYTQEDSFSSGAEILKAAGLDFNVRREPLVRVSPDGTQSEVPSHVALVRDDLNTTVGHVSKSYGVIQPMDFASMFDGVKHDLKFEICGSVRGGSRMYMMAKINRFEVLPGDPVDQYLFLYNSYDLSNAFQAVYTTVRLGCLNVMKCILDDADNSFTIKHTLNASARAKFVKDVIAATAARGNGVQDLYQHLAGQKLTNKSAHALVDSLIPLPPVDKKTGEFVRSPVRAENKRAELIHKFHHGRAQDIPGVQGTKWAMLNALTEEATWDRSVRGSSDERRFESAVMGTGNDFVQRGLKLIQAA